MTRPTRESRPLVNVAALLFAFWLLIMGGICLFLLGIAPVFSGTFSTTEIALAVVIGAASIAGLVQSYRPESTRSMAVRLTMVIGVCAVQSAALWVSCLSIVAGR